MRQKTVFIGKKLLAVLLTAALVVSTMLIGVVSVSAAITKGTTIYLDVSNFSWWYDDDCVTDMYLFTTSTSTWVSMETLDNDVNILKATVPSTGSYDSIIFVRKTAHSGDWTFTTNTQTTDITNWSSSKNLYKLTGTNDYDSLGNTKKYKGSWQSTNYTESAAALNYYIGGRFRVRNSKGGSFVYTGDSEGVWKGDSTSIPLVSEGDGLYKVDTFCTLAELSAQLGGVDPYFIVHTGSGHSGAWYSSTVTSLQNNSSGNPADLYKHYVIDTDVSRLMKFSDTSNTDTGLITLHFDLNNRQIYYTTTSLAGQYKISSASVNGGSLSISNANDVVSGTANQGDEITVTAEPWQGYDFTGLSADPEVTLSGSGNTRTFSMPASDVTLTASFTADKAKAFAGTMLWVDTQTSITNNLTALVKWTNRQGSAKTGSGTTYTLYLPGGAGETLPVYSNFTTLTINGTTVAQGGEYKLNDGQTYTVVGDGDNFTLRVYRSTSASMYVTTTNGDLPVGTEGKIIEKKKYTGGYFLGVDETGAIINNCVSLTQIKGRGNSSWESSGKLYGKYAFNMKLADKIKPLNMDATKAKSFCLLANNMDESMLRNITTFETASRAGLGFVPHYKVADFYNNGEYLGSYLITEKVDVGKSKLVNDGETIEDCHDADTATGDTHITTFAYNGNTITYQYVDNGDYNSDFDGKTVGDFSYLLEFDLESRAKAENSWFQTPQGQYIALKSPEDLNQAEMEFIIKKWIDAETAVYGGNYNQISNLIDVESFADVYLVQEFTKNLDSGATSYYVYYNGKKGGSVKWQATPIWDYDWALGGNDSDKTLVTSGAVDYDINCEVTSGWLTKYKAILLDDSNHTYDSRLNFQAKLANNETFWENDVLRAWNSDFYSTIKEVYGTKNTDDGYIYEAYSDNLASFTMNETRYGFIANNPISSWADFYDTGSTLAGTYMYLKNWALDRAAWMNTKLAVDISGVTISTNEKYPDINTQFTLTATPAPDYLNPSYTFYVSDDATLTDLSSATVAGTSTDGNLTLSVATAGVYYYYAKAEYTGQTTRTVTTQKPVMVEVVDPTLQHNVNIYFKAPTAAAYKLNVTMNGETVEMTKDQQLGTTFNGALTIYWYKGVARNVDPTKSNTLKFTTARTDLNASITNSFERSSYYFAVDDLMAGTQVVNLSEQPEYIRNFYHTATHMVYGGIAQAPDTTLGFTNIDGQKQKMGVYLTENPDGTLSAKSTVAAVTRVQKMTAELETASDLQTNLLDVNLDGKVDIKDATLIQRSLVLG